VLCHSRAREADVHGDLSDAEQASRTLNDLAPDVVVNLAALTDVDECERKPQLAYLTNVRIVENLGRWIRDSGNKSYLVQLSTDQVYDGPGPHKEHDVTLGNYYGFSKYAAELAATVASGIVLRTNFFGPSHCPGRRSLTDWLLQSLIQQRAITAFNDIRFSPLSIERLVDLLGAIVARRRQGIFNLGSRNGMSKAEFAYMFAAVMGVPTTCMTSGTSDRMKLVAYRPKDMRMDSSSFEDAFGVALPTLQEEIHSMKRAYAYEAG